MEITSNYNIQREPLRAPNNGVGLSIPTDNKKARSMQAAVNGNFTLAKKLSDEWNQEHSPKQGGMSEGTSKGIQMASKAIGGLAAPFTAMNDTGNTTALSVRNGITDMAINSGNPYAMAIGAALKVVDSIGDATGINLDNIDKDTAKRAGIDGGARFLNNAVQALPGIGTLLGAFGSITRSATDLDEYGNDILASYTNTENDIKAARSLGHKNFLGKAFRQADDYIYNTNAKASIMNQLGYTNSLVKNSDYSRDITQQNLARYAGTNYNLNAVGKNGMKILSRKELQSILAKRLQKGGIIGTDTNLLPEGSLHARLNHLDETNPDIDATRKGIPVLDANGDQVAEIERDEIIFRLELTKKIEELMKDGSEEAMIEAGKILVDEIIDNTQDNTGQIAEEVNNESR